MLIMGHLPAQATIDDERVSSVVSVNKINPTTVEVKLKEGKRMTIDFYGENIFRLFRDDNGGILRDPKPYDGYPEAQILVDNPRKSVTSLNIEQTDKDYTIKTNKIEVSVCKISRQIKVKNLATGKVVIEETAPVFFKKNKATITLKGNSQEYFFGGGVQNGRFSHAGKIIAIENQNSWTDGGVASPAPFFWSTQGYGFMWHTFMKGSYDFGATESNKITLTHDSDYIDVFFMVNSDGIALLNDFYQLTGNPVLIPKFGFYEGHLNAYNRDYWKESTDGSGVLFEDGKRYRESQKDNGGTRETLTAKRATINFRHVPLSIVTQHLICLSVGFFPTTDTEQATVKPKHSRATYRI